jgi:hypothetical protein
VTKSTIHAEGTSNENTNRALSCRIRNFNRCTGHERGVVFSRSARNNVTERRGIE